MTPLEREICARLKLFRERILWSQMDFSARIGLTYDQLAGIEYARTPLRYRIAWKIRDDFGLSLTWLLNGKYSAIQPDLDPWPNPDTLTKHASLLSEVGSSLWAVPPDHPDRKAAEKRWWKEHKIPQTPAVQRTAFLNDFQEYLVDCMERVPDNKLVEFLGQVAESADNYVRQFTGEPSIKARVWAKTLIWETFREKFGKALDTKESQKKELTDSATSGNLEAVNNQWPMLKRRLQKATAAPGSKSKLAKFLKVELSRVSQWLSDASSAREPGAEYALEMLQWVQQQERQQ